MECLIDWRVMVFAKSFATPVSSAVQFQIHSSASIRHCFGIGHNSLISGRYEYAYRLRYCIVRWVSFHSWVISTGGLGRIVLRIGWNDADCKILLVAYSV